MSLYFAMAILQKNDEEEENKNKNKNEDNDDVNNDNSFAIAVYPSRIVVSCHRVNAISMMNNQISK